MCTPPKCRGGGIDTNSLSNLQGGIASLPRFRGGQQSLVGGIFSRGGLPTLSIVSTENEIFPYMEYRIPLYGKWNYPHNGKSNFLHSYMKNRICIYMELNLPLYGKSNFKFYPIMFWKNINHYSIVNMFWINIFLQSRVFLNSSVTCLFCIIHM